MLRELSDRVFRTSEQIESLLQTHCIALVPLLEGAVQLQSRVAQRPARLSPI